MRDGIATWLWRTRGGATFTQPRNAATLIPPPRAALASSQSGSHDWDRVVRPVSGDVLSIRFAPVGAERQHRAASGIKGWPLPGATGRAGTGARAQRGPFRNH